jgi:hypothetical protein
MRLHRQLRRSGSRPRGRRWSAAICLALVLVAGSILLQACSSGSGGKGGSSTTVATGGGSSSTTTTLAALAQGKAGETMAVAGWKITVDAVETKAEIDGVKAPAGEELLVVHLTVANIYSRPVSLTVEDLSLKGDAGATYRAIDTKTGLFAMAPVPANGSSSTYVVFAIPTGAKSLKLHFTPFVEGKVSPREADITLR